jgi:hypothetical protein
MHFWRNEAPKEFLERLYDAGRADNRYQVFGYERHAEDLVKLDVLVFAVRRLCRRLDDSVHERLSEVTHRQMLREHETDWLLQLNGRLEQVIRGEDSALRDAACLFNFRFAPPEYEQPVGYVGVSMRRSALYREILRPVPRTSEDREILRSLVDWAHENIKLPQDVLKQLRQ